MPDSMNDLFQQAQAAEQADIQTAKEFVGSQEVKREQEGYQSTIDNSRQPQVGPTEAQQAQTQNDEQMPAPGSYAAMKANDRAHEPAFARAIDDFEDAVTKNIGSIPYAAFAGLAKGASEFMATWSPDTAKEWRQAGSNVSPTKLAESSVTGRAVEGISQFLFAFLPSTRTLKYLGVGSKVATAAGGFAAGVADFNPEDPRISDLIRSSPALSKVIPDYLASKPGDTEWDGRLKNGIEQTILGEVGEVGLKAMAGAVTYVTGVLKASRAAGAIADSTKELADTKPTPAPKPEVAPAANDESAGSAREHFLQDLESNTAENPDQPGQRLVNGKVGFELSKDPFDENTVHIENVRATEPGKGSGTTAMKVVTDLADKHGVRMTLDAIPLDKGGIEPEALQAFYKKHGFTPKEGGLIEGHAMERVPVAEQPTSEPKPWVPADVAQADTATPKSSSPRDLLAEQPRPGEAPSAVFEPHTLAAKMMTVSKEQAADVSKAIQEGRYNEVPDMLDDTHRTIPWDSLSDGANLKGVLNAVEDKIGTIIKANHGSGVVGDAQIKQLAADIGGDVGSLQRLYGQVTGEGGLAARITAGYNMLMASTKQLKDLAVNMKDLDLSSETGGKAALAFQKQLALHAAIQGEVRQSSAEIGRALYAHRFLKASTDVSLQNIMDYANTKLGPKALKDLASTVANAKDLRSITNAADAVSGKGWKSVLQEIATNGMLSGPTTQLTNVDGNFVKILGTVAERYLSGSVGEVRGVLFPSADHATLREAVAHTAGAYQGLKNAFGLAWQSLKDENFTSKFNGPTTRAIQRSTDGRTGLDLTYSQVINSLGKVVRYPGRLMGLMDHFSQSIGYQADLNARAYVQAAKEADTQGLQDAARDKFLDTRMSEITTSPTKAIDDKAMAAGRYTSYLEPAQTQVGQNVQKLFQNTPIIKLLVAPFTHRPGNIMRQGFFDYTLAGVATKNVRAQLAAGGSDADLAMARMAIGTGALVVGHQLAEQGSIVGAGLGGKNTESLDGVPKYSVKIGNTWYKYDRLDPVGLWLGLSADMTEAFHHAYDPNNLDANEALGHAAGASAMAITHTALDKTFMKSVDDLMTAMSEKDPVRAQELGEKLVSENVAKLVPFSGLLRSIEHGTDDAQRASGKGTLFDGVVTSIPYLAQQLPPRRDLLGRPLPAQSSWNPFQSTTGNTDKMDQELSRLAVNIDVPPRQIDGYQLNAQEYDEVVKTATQAPVAGGMNIEQYLRALTESPMWEANKKAPDGGQLRNGQMVQQALDSAYQYGRDMYKMQHPDLMQKKQQEQVSKFMQSIVQPQAVAQ